MSGKQYVTAEGRIIEEKDLTPELREELGIDENGNPIIDYDDDYDYRKEYVSEDDIARENEFYVDDDGHWRKLDEDDDLYW